MRYDTVIDLRAVLQTQADLVRRLDATVTRMEQQFAGGAGHGEQVVELQRLMDQIEAAAEFLEADDLASFDAERIPRLYADRQAAVAHAHVRMGCQRWDSFVRSCQAYTLQHGLDPFAPYEALLRPEDLARLDQESYDAQLRWDTWDYVFVGASGVLAALTDILLVGTPEASPLTNWIKQYNTATADDWFGHWARDLEQACRVPYDAMTAGDGSRIPGMHGRSHRFQSLGHDPVLGFVFGILDLMRGTISSFSYEHLRGRHAWIHAPVAGAEPIDLISAILRQIGHLISDVATPMGLPAPFMTLLQGINVGSFGEKGRTVGQVARWMYLNGYDLRHFLVSGLTPAVIEIVLRGYLLLRHYATYGDAPRTSAARAKERTMLLTAHAIAALANAGKVALWQGNPLAINVAEWYALVGYLAPSLHYWVLDAHRLRMEHLEQVTDQAWEELLAHGDALLTRTLGEQVLALDLGKTLRK